MLELIVANKMKVYSHNLKYFITVYPQKEITIHQRASS